MTAPHTPSWVSAARAMGWSEAEIAPLRFFVGNFTGAHVGDLRANDVDLKYAAETPDVRKLPTRWDRRHGPSVGGGAR